MKKVLRYFCVFNIMIFVFNVLLLMTSLFPSELIEDNVKETAEIMNEVGNYERISKLFPVINNNYTDSIIVNAAYSIDNKNPIYSYMAARKNYKQGITQKELMDIQGELLSLKSNSINEFTEEYDPVRRTI